MARRRQKYYNDADKELAGLLLFVLAGIGYALYKYRVVVGAILIVLAIISVALFFWLKKRRWNKINSWHSDQDLLQRLRNLHPSEFEERIADLYNCLGYKAKKVGQSHDHGVDVIADKNGVRHYIQCKKYITSKVGEPELRNFAGSLMDKLSKGKGVFITTNIFTEEAMQWAKDKPIELIDGNQLLKLIKLAHKDKEEIKIQEEENICPQCGGKLILRTARQGSYAGKQFYGCSNYPRCKYKKNLD